MSDPWQHRSSRMRCSTCMWSAWKLGDVGRCRRHAPTINGYPAIILSQDWCGDHKIDEEKYLPKISVDEAGPATTGFAMDPNSVPDSGVPAYGRVGKTTEVLPGSTGGGRFR